MWILTITLLLSTGDVSIYQEKSVESEESCHIEGAAIVKRLNVRAHDFSAYYDCRKTCKSS